VVSPKQPAAYGVADLDEFRARLSELRAMLTPPLERGAFTAHTDGACLGNPAGPGGWAAVVEPSIGDAYWDLWGHLSSTSNNRAEALGVLAALEWVPSGSNLLVRSDSELTVKILRRDYKVRANLDIWTAMFEVLTSKQLDIQTTWVRGHAGDPGNERADRLTMAGALNRDPLDLPDGPRRPVPSVPAELVGLEPRTAWEREFLQSLADQLGRGRKLSEKQQAIVDRMRERSKPGSARGGGR
jgi:ribonuclease HI